MTDIDLVVNTVEDDDAGSSGGGGNGGRVVGPRRAGFRECDAIGWLLPALQRLGLDGSRVGSLRDLGTGLRALVTLKLEDGGLRELDGASALPALRELLLPGNAIADATPLCAHAALQVRTAARSPPPPKKKKNSPLTPSLVSAALENLCARYPSASLCALRDCVLGCASLCASLCARVRVPGRCSTSGATR